MQPSAVICTIGRVLGEEGFRLRRRGPNVFELDGIKWMISDYWHGLAVLTVPGIFAHWGRCADIPGEIQHLNLWTGAWGIMQTYL